MPAFRLQFWILAVLQLVIFTAQANPIPADTSIEKFTLEACISYAIKNQALLKKSEIDSDITDRNVKANLAAWYPQLRLDFGLQHSMILPTSFFPNLNNPNGPRMPIKTGVPNMSNALFQLDQVIFNNEVMLASKAAGQLRLQAEENITNSKITLIVNVTKAFYDAVLAEERVKVLDEDMVRQQKLLHDSYALYQTGVNDKLDYQRTTISINNTLAQRKRNKEALDALYVFLKQLMGYPQEKAIQLELKDPSSVNEKMQVDTNVVPNYENRIEYQQLETQKQLQLLNVKYYKWGFLPSVSAFVNYNFVYQNQEFTDLYSKNYPNSVTGIRASVPIFQGTRRYQNLQAAKLQAKRIDLDMEWYKAEINTEYSKALGAYKSSVYNFQIQKDNLKLAKEVYELIKLQYDQGIKSYLDVSNAESELRDSNFNYLNALFVLYLSNLELERTLGTINTNY